MKDFLTLENQLCFALYETNSLFSKLYTQALQPFKITYPQYLVLLVLWEEDGQAIKQIGDRLNLGTGTLTPMIKRMENNGWIIKRKNPEDERKVNIHLSEKAIEDKAEITASIAKHIQACHINYEEYITVMNELNNLQEKLTKYVSSVS